MASTDIELNRPLSLERVESPSPALTEAQSYYRDPEGRFAGVSENLRTFICIPIAALFPLSLAINFASLSSGMNFGPSLWLSGALGAILGWATIPKGIWWLKMEKLKKRATPEISETTAAIEGWLQGTYGMVFVDDWAVGRVARGLLGLDEPLHQDEEFTLRTQEGMKVQAQLELNGAGRLELKKSHATDSNDSPYFAPIREELS